jgi:glycosyltransferase involved in cell wall biosynthesis
LQNNTVAILSVAHDLGDKRIHRLAEALIDNDVSVHIYGTGDIANGPKNAICFTAHERTYFRRALRAFYLPFFVKADAFLIVDPDLALSALLARRLRRVSLLICDIHENYLDALIDRDWATGIAGFFGRLIARSSTWVASKSDFTLVADTYLQPLKAPRRIVVQNMPKFEETPNSPQLLSHPPKVVYIGDVRKSRGVFEMITAIKSAGPWELDIIGPAPPSIQGEIELLSASCTRIRFHGRLSPDATQTIVLEANVGICFLHQTPAFIEAMPTKIYEYAASGKAIITSPLPRPAAFVSKNKIGAVASDGDSISSTLMHWYANPDILAVYQANAQTWATHNASEPDPFIDATKQITKLLSQRSHS